MVKAAQQLKPDLVIADVSMPLLNGIEAARQILVADPKVKIIFLSMHPDVVYVSEALQAGGSAYVLKSSAGFEILTAIREVLQGRTYVTPSIDRATLEAQIKRDQRSRHQSLSPRRREVLQLVAEGRSTKQIAEIMRISPRRWNSTDTEPWNRLVAHARRVGPIRDQAPYGDPIKHVVFPARNILYG